MISPYLSYILGVLTILIPIIIIYILSFNYVIIDNVWGSLFCIEK